MNTFEEINSKMYKFWFDKFNDRYPDEVAEIMDSQEYEEFVDSITPKV